MNARSLLEVVVKSKRAAGRLKDKTALPVLKETLRLKRKGAMS